MSGKVNTKLFIGNLPDYCKRDELLTKFEKFGNVVEFDIVSNYGFAHYEKPDEARAAADALNGSSYNGNTLRVEISHSKVRQRPGMGDREGCYRCGKEGHWSKDCPRGPRRPRRDYREDPYEDDPYYQRDPYEDPYYRSRYLPPPPSYRRYDPYYDPYDRRPVPSRDPYMRERVPDPYARADSYYYARRSPPPSSGSVSAAAASAASSRDLYGKDPYAGARSAESRDPYDDYIDRRRPYSAATTQSSAYSRGTNSSGYGMGASSAYPAAASSSYSSAAPSAYSSTSSTKFSSSTVQSSRVPGPY
ncbi:uncharacterized protein LOC143296158 isoform X2 [Babylonia areolata]|uniref:uncharacterized protein LOC143296158 isoform X2 n=1 Tax=Babylonia areolata TaxID=304850 RepID=UPI003FD68B5A